MEFFLLSVGFLIGSSIGFALGARHASIQLVKSLKPLLEQIKTVNANARKIDKSLWAASCNLADILKTLKAKEVEFWNPKE